MQGLNEDSNAVQNATGEKVGQFIHHIATFVGGIAIGGLHNDRTLATLRQMVLIEHWQHSQCPGVCIMTAQSCVGQQLSFCRCSQQESARTSCAAAFWKCWKLTLVMISVLPLLAGCGLAFGSLMGKLSSQSSDAYGRANSIVQQARS